MRVAVISDIHGNIAALEAVLEGIEALAVDRVVVAGDVVNGAPDSRACWELLRSLGHPILRGNHERYLFDLGTPNEDPEWRGERFGPVRWTASQFTREELEEMRSLPLCLRLPDAPDLLIVHASPASDTDDVQAHTPDSDLRRMFEGVAERLIVRGHNHLAATRPYEGGAVITCGSAGLSLDGTGAAKFLLLEHRSGGWRCEHRSLPYDVEATVARFRAGDYLERAGPMARLLLREVATGSHQMVPFLRGWERWSRGGALGLGVAVESFLNAY